MGATDNICNMHLNAFKNLVDDSQVVEAGVKGCTLTSFDQLFVQLNAGSENPRALNRPEFVEALVRIAGMLYVIPDSIDSFPEALRALFATDLVPALDRRSLQDSRVFREQNCYNQDVSEMLDVFAVSLRSIFTQYAKGAGAIGDEMDDVKLMSYQEFKQLVRDLQLCEADFTAREVDLAFIWSRMRIVDERPIASRKKLMQLRYVLVLLSPPPYACAQP